MSIIRFISFSILFLISTNLSAGAWTREKGEGYSQFSLTFINSGRLFLNNGSSVYLRRNVTDITLQYYLEYGISDRLMLVSQLPFKVTQTNTSIIDISGKNNLPAEISTYFTDTLKNGKLIGFSNVHFSLQYQLINKEYVLSVKIDLGLPVSLYDPTNGLRTGYQSTSAYPSLWLGKSWDKHFISSNIGINLRSNNYSNELRCGIEWGYKANEKLLLIGVLELWKSLYDGNVVDGNAWQTGMYVNNQESISYGIKVIYANKKGWGLNMAGYGAFSGNFVAHFPALSTGISYEW